MADLLFGLACVFWMGVLTSLLPCPMTINAAAIAYLSGSQRTPRRVLLGGLLYAAGQAAAYVAAAALVSFGALGKSRLSLFLQTSGKELVGPLLIVLGMMLLDLLPLGFSTGAWGERLRSRIGGLGLGGSFLLGGLLALSFCPPSAAAFFSILPVAVRLGAPLAVPAAFALGAALPVVAVALVLSAGADRLGAVFGRLAAVQRWARTLTGAALLAAGVYYSVVYIWL